MNEQELIDEINKTKAHLADMEKMLEICKNERWKPEEGEKYYFIDHSNKVYETEYRNRYDYCKDMYDACNCFKTKEEAEQEAEKILVRRQLEDVARRLNSDAKIDWNDYDLCKYYLYLWRNEELEQGRARIRLNQGTIHCLDESFIDVAIQEIGEERLKKYLRGE